MRSVYKRPGAFAILVPTPGLILLQAFLLWQCLAALTRARDEVPSLRHASTVSATGEAVLWASLALTAALLGLMFRWGDQVERSRCERERR